MLEAFLHVIAVILVIILFVFIIITMIKFHQGEVDNAKRQQEFKKFSKRNREHIEQQHKKHFPDN